MVEVEIVMNFARSAVESLKRTGIRRSLHPLLEKEYLVVSQYSFLEFHVAYSMPGKVTT